MVRKLGSVTNGPKLKAILACRSRPKFTVRAAISKATGSRIATRNDGQSGRSSAKLSSPSTRGPLTLSASSTNEIVNPELLWTKYQLLKTVALDSERKLVSSFSRIPVPTLKLSQAPSLKHGLERVLFTPGPHMLRCPRTGVLNFPYYLERITHSSEFNFDALPGYLRPGEDKDLGTLVKNVEAKYFGATSTTTVVLQHLHFLLSNQRDINVDRLSKAFNVTSRQPTRTHSGPASMFLRRTEAGMIALERDDGHFDAFKELVRLGHVMETKLVVSDSEFQTYLLKEGVRPRPKGRIEEQVHRYFSHGKFLVRSQIDASHFHSESPAVFDLKSRAVLPVRRDNEDRYQDITSSYEIDKLTGDYNSFEREVYDMSRTTMMKYSLQARLGSMNGIFVAYHNMAKVLGFQFLARDDMDFMMHGQTHHCLGDQELHHSFEILEEVFEQITDHFPDGDIWVHFKTSGGRGSRGNNGCSLTFFAEQVTPELMQYQEAINAEIEKCTNPKQFENRIHQLTEKIIQWAVSAAAPLQQKLANMPPESDIAGVIEVQDIITMVQAIELLVKKHKALRVEMTLLRINDEASLEAMKRVEDYIERFSSFAELLDPSLLEKAEEAIETLQPKVPAGTADFESIDLTKAHNPANLLALKVTVTNIVNGVPVLRPNNLNPNDRWDAHHEIEVVPQKLAIEQYRDVLKQKYKFRLDMGGSYRDSVFQQAKYLSQRALQRNLKNQKRQDKMRMKADILEE